MERLPRATDDPLESLRAAIAELVPAARVDGALQPDRLLAALGLGPDRERFGLGWSGKGEARRLARLPSAATLRPDRAGSRGFDDTADLLVWGDNLEALKLLRAPLAGRVHCIVIDPPYNTGRDFVYADDFRARREDYLRASGQVDPDGWSLGEELEVGGRRHSAWLSMMFPRLLLARELLHDDGVLFVHIDEHEHAALVLLGCEVFGEDCFLGDFVWKKKSGGGGDVAAMVLDHEYVVAFGRRPDVRLRDDAAATVATRHPHQDEQGRYALERLDKQNLGYEASLDFPIEGPDGQVYAVEHRDPAHKRARWRWSRATVEARRDELVFRGGRVYTKNRQKPGARPRSLLVDERFGRTRSGRTDLVDLLGAELLDHPKPVRLIKHLVGLACPPDGLVLDFFAGSGTTGQAVVELNRERGGSRRFVLIQLPAAVPAGSEAQRAGLAHIGEITAARLAAVGASFRLLQVDDSGLEAPGRGLSAQLRRPDRSDDDLFVELLLRAGVDPGSPWRSLGPRTVEAGGVVVCLGGDVEAALEQAESQLVATDEALGADEGRRQELALRARRRGVRLRIT